MADLAGCIGLRQKSREGRQLRRQRARSSRCDEDADGRPSVSDHGRKRQTIHRSRHLDIGENQHDIVALLKVLQRLIGRGGFQNAEARFLKYIDRIHSDENIVFHDENELLHELTFGRRDA